MFEVLGELQENKINDGGVEGEVFAVNAARRMEGGRSIDNDGGVESASKL